MLYFNSLYNVHVRAVTRGQGPGICPGFYEHDHWLLSRKKEGKTKPKELPSGSISHVLQSKLH